MLFNFFLDAQFKTTQSEIYVTLKLAFKFFLNTFQTPNHHRFMMSWRLKQYINYSDGKLLGFGTGGSWQLHYRLVRNQLHLNEDTSPWVSCPAWGSGGTNTDSTQQRCGTSNTVVSCSSREAGSQPKASFLNNSLGRETGFEKCCSFGFSFPDPWP